MEIDLRDGPGPFEMEAQGRCKSCGAMGPVLRLEAEKVRQLIRETVKEQRRRKLGGVSLGPRARRRAILESFLGASGTPPGNPGENAVSQWVVSAGRKEP